MSCCINPYQICQPLPQCSESLTVFVPVDYSEASIALEITNGQGIGQLVELDVITDRVEIDVAQWPDGFFNPYSGIFTLKFFDPFNPANPIEFVAIDGKTYNSATFSFQQVSSTYAVINLFGYIETGYYS